MKRSVIIKSCMVAGVTLVAALLLTVFFGKDQKPREGEIWVGAICYHKFYTEREIKANGEMDTYAIWVEEFETHLQYLQEQKIRTITVTELQDYVEGKLDLPEKCVLLTVDDCNITFYKYAYPLLQKYDAKVNAAVIGDRADWASEGTSYREHYCTWEEIAEMAESGYVEFGSHTYGLHDQKDGRKGTMMKPGESIEDYGRILMDDAMMLNQKLEDCVGYGPKFFVYPYYAVSMESIPILQEEMDYEFLFCGDSESARNYMGSSIHATNYNPFVKGEEPGDRMIKRYTPRSGDDFEGLIRRIFQR